MRAIHGRLSLKGQALCVCVCVCVCMCVCVCSALAGITCIRTLMRIIKPMAAWTEKSPATSIMTMPAPMLCPTTTNTDSQPLRMQQNTQCNPNSSCNALICYCICNAKIHANKTSVRVEVDKHHSGCGLGVGTKLARYLLIP